MPKRKKHIISKTVKKRMDGKCKFCDCSVYELLDLHRINEGSNGGLYTDPNTVTCCANCHRKIHAGYIKIDRHYPTVSGKSVLHYWIDGVEHYE